MDTGCRDAELLADLRNDSTQAFNAIYCYHSKPLYIYLLDKLKDPDLCQDVLQDIFISVWEKRQNLHVNISLKAYLFQSARYKIIDIYRKDIKYKKYLAEFADQIIADQFNIAHRIDQKKALSDVEQAINNLPNKMKEIFILSRFEHQSTRDIAEKTNLSQQTVKNQISKALRLLRVNYMGIDIILLFLSMFYF